MAVRSAFFETVQIGVETTSGSNVPANKTMGAWGLLSQPVGQIATYRPRGKKVPTTVIVGREHSEAAIEGVLDFQCLWYLLAGLVEYNAPTQHTTVTTAYTWTATPSPTAGDTVKTYSVEQGSSVRAHEFSYGQVTGLSFSFTAGGDTIPLTGSMIGQEIADGITLTATPTEVAAQPAPPKGLCVYIDDSWANLGNTKMEKLLSLDWNYTDKFAPFFTGDCAETSFKEVVEQAATLGGTIVLEANDVGMGFLTQARAGAPRYMRIEITGNLIGGTTYYKLTIDGPVVFEQLPELPEVEAAIGASWAFAYIYDGANFLEITGVNTLTAL